jgi:hypothetical protein
MTPDNSIRQATYGKNGHNQVNLFNHPVSEASNETKTMIAIVSYLSSEVDKTDISLDIQFEKNINRKFYERFKDESQPVIDEFTDLMPLYAAKYEDAQDTLSVSETRLSEIAVLISRKSKELLNSADNKFVAATESVIKWLSEEIASHIKQLGLEDGYSECAVRFFVFKKLEECNVFPNEAVSNEK